MVYSRVFKNVTIDLSLQLCFNNAAIGPCYNHVLNAAQSGFIAVFFTKRSYRSQLYGVKNAAIG